MTERRASAGHHATRRAAAGVSLIEVMISMVLALITFLIMFQMFESWDRNKRSTASGGGAMITGALAMFRLERDLRLAGFGFGNASELGCTVTAYDTTRPDDAAPPSGVSTTTANVFSFLLAPLQIVNGAGGAPDRIVTLYGSSEGVSATRFFGTSAAGAQPYTAATATTTTMEIGAMAGIQQGDLVVIAQSPTACNLVEATDTSNSDRRTFSSTGTNYTHFYTTAANTAPRYNNPAGVTVTSATGRAYVLGPRPQRRIWQVRNNRTLAFSNDLGWTDLLNNTTGAATADGLNDLTDVADNIVNLQAEYGLVAAVDGGTGACTPANTPTWTATMPSASCQAFVWAVRVALLARSDQFEKIWGVPASGGSAVAPQWAAGSFTMANVDGTADSYAASTVTAPSRNPNDWRHYRYRVFESIIPLKNVMWGSR